jgi:hypothetical protein
MTSPGMPPLPGTDTALVSAGYVAVTELHGIRGHHDTMLGPLPAQIEDAIEIRLLASPSGCFGSCGARSA